MISFVLHNGNLPKLIEYLQRLDVTKKFSVEVKPFKSKRSFQQNKWIRKYAAEFGKHFGYDADFAYDMLMYKFNPVFKVDLDGNEIRTSGHFSKLNTAEAAEVQDAVNRYGAEHGFYFSEML